MYVQVNTSNHEIYVAIVHVGLSSAAHFRRDVLLQAFNSYCANHTSILKISIIHIADQEPSGSPSHVALIGTMVTVLVVAIGILAATGGGIVIILYVKLSHRKVRMCTCMCLFYLCIHPYVHSKNMSWLTDC